MSSNNKSAKGDKASTYVIYKSKKEAELHRLVIQDRMITTTMGGVLPEQANPGSFQRILDVGCGSGGWLLDVAQISLEMQLVGVDINPHRLEYAREQAETQGLAERMAFREMDVLQGLDFPENSFDLVNLRFGISYVRTWDWPNLLLEMQRVARPGGVIRVTECETGHQCTSLAMIQLNAICVQALYRAGNLFTEESTGLTNHLAQLLTNSWCEDVQTKASLLEFQAGTPEGQLFNEDMRHGYQAMRPFIQKWTGISKKEYDALYHQFCKEMEQPNFCAIWPHVTAWGKKPLTRV